VFLYRGVSKALDNHCNGKIMPKGDQNTAIPESGEEGVECGAGYECGYSEGNGLRAHQVDSNMKKLSFVSTSKCIEVAKKFATKQGTTDGVVYTLDMTLFKEFNVISLELENPIYPTEQEVSIRSKDNGMIPENVIIDKLCVNCT
jgi:hypothetical protein